LRAGAAFSVLIFFVVLGAGWRAMVVAGDYGADSKASPRGAVLTSVDPGGAAHRAGLRPGDVVLAVDGRPMGDKELWSGYPAPAPGETATLRVQRAGEGAGAPAESDVVVTLRSNFAAPVTVANALTFTLVGTVTLAVSVLVAVARPQDRAARQLLVLGAGIALLLALAVWGFADSIAGVARAVFLAAAFAAAALLHFFLLFPTEHPALARLRPAGPAPLSRLGVGVLALYAVPILVALVATIDFSDRYWSFMFETLLVGLAAWRAAGAYRRPATPLVRAQLRWVFWALIALLIAVLIFLVAPFLATGGIPALSFAAVSAAWALSPLAIAFAVLRYRLFEVDLVLRATLLYPLLAALLVGGYVAIAFLFGRLAALALGPAAESDPTVQVLAALTVAAAILPARRLAQNALDRLFFRDRLRRAHFLDEATEELARAQPMRSVVAFLTDRAAKSLGLTGAWLVLPTSVVGAADESSAPAESAPLLRRTGEIVDAVMLVGEDVPAGGAPTFRADEPALAPWYAAGARALVPLRAQRSESDGRPGAAPTPASAPEGDVVVGAWLLGARASGDLLDRDDLAALSRVGSQAAVLLDYNGVLSLVSKTLAETEAAYAVSARYAELLRVVIELGIALSSERDFARLLERVVEDAMALCYADAGSLYLRTDTDSLEFVVMRNRSRGIALGGTTGEPIPFPPLPLTDPSTGAPNRGHVVTRTVVDNATINVADAYAEGDLDLWGTRVFDEGTGYRSVSFLCSPLRDSEGRPIGVLQMINALDPETGQVVPFDSALSSVLESLAALATVALAAYVREQHLRQEISQLQVTINDSEVAREVSGITETDFFRQLRSQADRLRQKTHGRSV
jgi:hypothetical protein